MIALKVIRFPTIFRNNNIRVTYCTTNVRTVCPLTRCIREWGIDTWVHLNSVRIQYMDIETQYEL